MRIYLLLIIVLISCGDINNKLKTKKLVTDAYDTLDTYEFISLYEFDYEYLDLDSMIKSGYFVRYNRKELKHTYRLKDSIICEYLYTNHDGSLTNKYLFSKKYKLNLFFKDTTVFFIYSLNPCKKGIVEKFNSKEINIELPEDKYFIVASKANKEYKKELELYKEYISDVPLDTTEKKLYIIDLTENRKLNLN